MRIPAPVAGIRLRTRGAAVIEIEQSGERKPNDVMRGGAAECRDEGNAAGVMLRGGVVEALRGGQS